MIRCCGNHWLHTPAPLDRITASVILGGWTGIYNDAEWLKYSDKRFVSHIYRLKMGLRAAGYHKSSCVGNYKQQLLSSSIGKKGEIFVKKRWAFSKTDTNVIFCSQNQRKVVLIYENICSTATRPLDSSSINKWRQFKYPCIRTPPACDLISSDCKCRKFKKLSAVNVCCETLEGRTWIYV